MAQIEIHPKQKTVLYKFSGGRSMELSSTYTKSSDFLLETDIFIHPAWKEDEKAVNTGSVNVNKFNATFGGVSPLGSFSQGSSVDINSEVKMEVTPTAPVAEEVKKASPAASKAKKEKAPAGTTTTASPKKPRAPKAESKEGGN